jgi:hypothetical protein
MQTAPMQDIPPPQALPGQQGCVDPPQAWHCPLAQMAPGVHRLLGQQD